MRIRNIVFLAALIPGAAFAQDERPETWHAVPIQSAYEETTGVILTDISIPRSEQARLIREAARPKSSAQSVAPVEDVSPVPVLPEALQNVPLVPSSVVSANPGITPGMATASSGFSSLSDAAKAGINPLEEKDDHASAGEVADNAGVIQLEIPSSENEEAASETPPETLKEHALQLWDSYKNLILQGAGGLALGIALLLVLRRFKS